MLGYPVGLAMYPMNSTLDKVGQVLLFAESRQELFRRAGEVVTWFGERTVIVPPKASRVS